MAGDPYWNETVLLLHCDGSSIVDQKGHAVTVVGNTVTSAAQYAPLTGNTKAAYFDGSGDRLSFAASADWDFSAGNFTIEFQCYPTSLPGAGNQCRLFLIGANGSASALDVAILTDGTLFIGTPTGSAGWSSSAGAIVANQWNNISIDVDGAGLVTAFKAGVVLGTPGTMVLQTSSSANQLFIGYDTVGTVNFNYVGYLDEVRFTKKRRHTAAYTPDTVPFPDAITKLSGVTKDESGTLASKLVRAYRQDTGALVSQHVSAPSTGAFSLPAGGASKYFITEHDTANDPFFAQTKALLHMEGTPGAAVFTDVTGRTVTNTGSPITSNAVAHGGFGSTVAGFNGSSNIALSNADGGLNFGTGDFTVEFWAYPTALANYITFFGGTIGELSINTGAAGYVAINKHWTSTPAATVTGLLTINTWTHICVERCLGWLSIYINGVMKATVKDLSAFNFSLSPCIGSSAYSTGREWLTGYIDDLRITVGAGRYGGDFTIPASAYPDAGITSVTANAAVLDNLIPV